MKKRLHTYYTGRVQGVGFRFSAEELALSMGIKGWVKNLADGKVEVLAEGEEEALTDFSGRLEIIMRRYIQKKDISWEQYTGEFRDFEIKFY
ncbi:MAG: acylphosphatase [Candidatus Omnitrophica bacterium]|nr:acylphosphatase [Candidatus Omnitrophota bacterium]